MDLEKRIINTKGSLWRHRLLNWIANHKEFPTRLRMFNVIKKLFKLDLLLFRTPSGLSLLLDISDWVQYQIYFFGSYEIESLNLFKKLSQNATVVFDVGAHVGQYALECAHADITREKKIFAIEVNPKTFTYLLNNIQLNKFKNITPVLGAVAANSEILNINIPAYWNMGNTQIAENGNINGFNNYLVASFSIVSLLKKCRLKHIDLLKIDVEGHELSVLKDLFTASVFPSNIILEFIPAAFSQCPELITLLQDNQYMLKDVKGNSYNAQTKFMGSKNLIADSHIPVSLVIFTCENREHLIFNAFNSFKKICNYSFSKTILAIDGKINASVIDFIQPDIVIQSPVRRGYINNILRALRSIETEYFFWLEDDWKFNVSINFAPFIQQLKLNNNWVQVVYSKDGPLTSDLKSEPLANCLYKNLHGFSANPCICKTTLIREGFEKLLLAPKGDRLGEDGFENFLSRYFDHQNLICVIHDPVDHIIISHEGYLESTPRNWHMTNSLEQKTEKHLLTIPPPPFWRKLIMALRLAGVFFKISLKQFVNNEVYELCFRILASVKTMKKNG